MYYIKNNDLNVETFEDGTVLYDSEKKELYLLNETASFLWKNCENNNKEKLINCFLLALEHEADAPSSHIIKEECSTLIDILVKKGIIYERYIN
ncbi:MAG: PqqD family protein [Ruminococcaceae bacterium]|nr:PqqD family protein [Oscillospiraceae bacterium]